MNRSALYVMMAISVFLCGCGSKNNIPISDVDVVGTWSAIKVPEEAKEPMNGNTQARFVLEPNGVASFTNLLIEKLTGSFPHRSVWSLTSGTESWRLKDWGLNGGHQWRVDLDTPTIGIQLLVNRDSAGACSLKYEPDPDKPRVFVLYQKESKPQTK